MNKKIFITLVILMSLSLIGIIFVQGYWITTSVANKEEQFSTTINQVLQKVSNAIERKEVDHYLNMLSGLSQRQDIVKDSTLMTSLIIVDRDHGTNETFVYSHGILEEKYSVPPAFFEKNSSATPKYLKNYISKSNSKLYKENMSIDGSSSYNTTQTIDKTETFSDLEKLAYENAFKQYAKRKPIHRRVSSLELQALLKKTLLTHGITTAFEYGVYANNLATKLRSSNFTLEEAMVHYKAPLFTDSNGRNGFTLYMSFPKKKKFLLSSIRSMVVLSIIFTLIIIVAYSSALYQLNRQKQISEIKTDFINNMTHEFKTPIATINLALDAIKNPKIIVDPEKITRYLQMIKEENKRMHLQVENVLRISKLEKNQLDIRKENVLVNDLLEEAISHVYLLVEDRKGYIKEHFTAEPITIKANTTHFVNILVNVLDNAIKYSVGAPEIDVYTYIEKKQVCIKIKDKGLGMSKVVQKRIFEKFYREHTGNLHNVKGHGLGLSYVKKIVEDHQGEISVESEKDKGSTFYIKVPLI